MSATCLTLMSALMFAQTPAGEKAPVKAEAKAKVVFVQASPDAGAVDVLVNGKKEITGLAFGKPSEAKELAAGEAKIELKADDKVVLTYEAKLAGDKQYVVAAIGTAKELKAHVVECKFTAGKAHVIVLNASPDAGAVDVSVAGKDCGKGLAMGKTCESAVESGKTEVEVKAGEAALAKKSVEAKADECCCVILAGMAKGTPKIELIAVEAKAAKHEAKHEAKPEAKPEGGAKAEPAEKKTEKPEKAQK